MHVQIAKLYNRLFTYCIQLKPLLVGRHQIVRLNFIVQGALPQCTTHNNIVGTQIVAVVPSWLM